MDKGYIIAIDGPAASGKSTTAKRLAEMFGYTYIDTGAMYRTVALKIIDDGIDYRDHSELDKMLSDIRIEFRRVDNEQHVFLDERDVSTEIRAQNVTKMSSEIAILKQVRDRMVELQREMGRDGGIVMDGRDIGTVVFPDADFKFFLTASVKTRALRRWKEIGDKNIPLEEIERELVWRDHNDSSRAIAPLRKAEDAIEVDTTEMSIEDQVNYIKKIIIDRK